MKLHNYPPQFDARRDMVIDEDFLYIVTGDLWTVVATDSGTATVGDEPGGVLTIAPSDGTVADNDEVYVHTTHELFMVAADTPMYAECEIKWTEANTDDANVIFGFANAVAADHLQDNGVGPPANYSGAVIFKVDGGTVWQCESSVATAQVTTVTTQTAGGSAFQKLGISVQPVNATIAEVMFSIDGQPFTDASNNTVKHSLTYTSITNMNLFVGVKNGSANNESVKIDAIRALQRKA